MNKTEILCIRVSKSEREELSQKAKERGMTVSNLMRTCINNPTNYSRTVVPEINRLIYLKLGLIQEKIAALPTNAQIQELTEEIKQLRLTCLGINE